LVSPRNGHLRRAFEGGVEDEVAADTLDPPVAEVVGVGQAAEAEVAHGVDTLAEQLGRQADNHPVD
jgi:hypothetical protein